MITIEGQRKALLGNRRYIKDKIGIQKKKQTREPKN
jgi:hypothetical protein